MDKLNEQIAKMMGACNFKQLEDADELDTALDVPVDSTDSLLAVIINASIDTATFNEQADEELDEALKKAKGFRDDEGISSIVRNTSSSLEIEIPEGQIRASFLIDLLKKYADYRVWKGSIYVKAIGAFHYIPLPNSSALRSYLFKLICDGNDKKLRSLQRRIKPSKAKRIFTDIMDDPFAQDAGKDFINNGNCILTANGVCIVEDGIVKLVSHNKVSDNGLLFTYSANASYDLNAKHDSWDRFLNIFIGKKPEDRKRFWQLVGNLLFPNPAAKAIVIMHGNGNDGKTLLCKVIKRILAPLYAVCDADSTTAFSTFGIASFANAQLVFLHELNRTISQLSADIIKRLTGGDGVMINRKHKDIVDALLKLKLLITCNHLPRFAPGVIDQALINRLQFLKVKAPPKALEDKELADKLYDERDYFLTMAILGYAELQKNNYQFDTSKKDEQLEKTVLGIDPAIAFRNDCSIINDKGFMPSADFKAALKIWQKDSLDTSKIKDFKNSLQNLGYRFGKNGKKDYRNTYGFFGLELNETYRKAITRTFKEVENNGKPDKH